MNILLINRLKHHLPSIIQFIQQPSIDYTIDLLSIGDSLMDLYIGDMTVTEIWEEISLYLIRENIFERVAYEQKIEHSGFQELVLSDHSKWILLVGAHETQYIHIHPARHSPNTMRVKATALKTVIGMFLEAPYEEWDTRHLNPVRRKIGLSPIKNLKESQHLLKLLDLVRDKMRSQLF